MTGEAGCASDQTAAAAERIEYLCTAAAAGVSLDTRSSADFSEDCGKKVHLVQQRMRQHLP